MQAKINPFTGGLEIERNDLKLITPVNAVASTGTIEFTGAPATHVDNVLADGTITVAGTPAVLVANVQATGTVTVTGTPLEHVDHVHASGEITVTGTPLEHVDHVHASGEITVTGTPLVHVPNAQATGSITVTGTPAVDETLTVGTQVFTFKAVRGGAGQISIDEDNTDQAGYIVAAITADIPTEATATNTLGVVSVTAVAAGAAGNAVDLAVSATGVAVSGSGHLAGGVDHVHESVTIGAQEFIFVTTRSGAGEITVDADNTDQADNIVTAITADLATVTADHTLGVVTVTAVAEGVAGNAIDFTEVATGVAVSGSGHLASGLDEVPAQTLTVGAQTFTFVAARGGLGEITIAADNTDQAHNIITAINADLATVTADHTLGVATVTAAAEGVAGNAIDFTEDATGVAVSGSGHLASGIDEVAAQTLTVGAQEFTFVTSRSGVGEITIAADNTDQAHNIVTAIAADLVTVTADHALGVVTVTAVAAGTGGNVIVFTKAATGVAVSGSGTLAGGIDAVTAATLTVGAQTFTFVTTRSGAGQITVSANTTTQAHNIVTAITADLATVTADHALAVVTVTAVAEGVAGNSITFTQASAGTLVLTTAPLLSGGVDHVHESVSIGDEEFIFVTARGGAGEVTVGGNVTDTAHNLITAVNLDSTNVTADHSSGVATITAAIKGTSGDAITLTDNAANMTVGHEHLEGGVDGTVGHKRDMCVDDTYLYVAIANNTVAGANWRRVALGSVF